jgi:EpsD family peptidyl-prolyl cis-trans isomerase
MVAGLIAVTATLGGCDQVKKLVGGGKPSGQVVATVNGDEITALELRQEMGGFSSGDPAIVKLAQQRALDSLIMRRLIVQKAKEQKLDKTADYSVQLQRGEDSLLTQLYQSKIASGVAVPTRDEAETYISSHPEKFSGRKVMILDQIISGPIKMSPEQLKAIKTFDELRAALDAQHVPYQANVATLDSLTVNPNVLAQINKLPPDELFVIPQGGSMIFNRIVETRPAPFEGDTAVAYAINVLRTQRAKEAVLRQLDVMRKTAEPSIVYNEAYKPQPKAKTAAAAPAPAPTSAAPAVAAEK